MAIMVASPAWNRNAAIPLGFRKLRHAERQLFWGVAVEKCVSE